MAIDFTKLPSDRRISVWVGPSGGTTLGITDIGTPLAAELNNTGGTSAMQPASQSISWNDWSFGMEASDTNNEPSLADSASYETFGQSNYGGDVSYYYPEAYDDNSNLHSVIYDLTDIPGELNDVAVRIDGDLLTTVPAADGQFVSAYRVEVDGEQNPFTPGESKRRTVTYIPKGEFSHWTVTGAHTLVAIPRATTPWKAGSTGRLRVSISGRDVTNMMNFSTSNGSVVDIYPGGFYKVTGTTGGTATITITDPTSSATQTQTVTVTA